LAYLIIDDENVRIIQLIFSIDKMSYGETKSRMRIMTILNDLMALGSSKS
jgi:hypothetical protein